MPQQQAHGKLTAPDRQEPVQEDGNVVDGDRPADGHPARSEQAPPPQRAHDVRAEKRDATQERGADTEMLQALVDVAHVHQAHERQHQDGPEGQPHRRAQRCGPQPGGTGAWCLSGLRRRG